MPIVRFDQDPDLPPGAGTFHGDDGSTFFAHDPEMASQLEQPSPELEAVAYPLKDERTALAGFPDTGSRLDAGNYSAPGVEDQIAGMKYDAKAPAPAPAAAPQSSEDIVRASLAQPAMSSEAAPAPAQPQSPALGQAEQLQSNIDAYAMRPVYEAGHKGGVVPTTQQETREANGMPYDPNGPEAQARAEASINRGLAYSEQQNAQAARAAGEAAAYQAALPKLEEEARIAQMRRDAQERQYRRDRDDLEKAIEDSNKSAKSFNANKWFDDRGAIGNIGAAIAQAFGAGAATLTGGPNVVLNQINSYIDRDIANQRAAIEADERNANNALARLNRQFGNLDQAEAALKIAQQKKVETMAQSYAASTKSEDIQKALGVWLADNEASRVAEEQKFQNAAYGKTSLTTAAKVIPTTHGGMRAPTEAEVQKRYETLNKRGAVVGGTYENEIKRQKAEGQDPEKRDKTNELVIEDVNGNQLLARRPEEATKIREMRSLHTNARGSLDALSKLAKNGSSLSPDDQRSFDMNLEQVVNSANTIAGQGVVRGEDMARIKASLQNKVGSMPAEKAVAELKEILDRSYQARVDAQRGSAVKVAETKAGQQVKYTGQSSKTPTAKNQFRQVGR